MTGSEPTLRAFIERNRHRMDPDADPVMPDRAEVVLYATVREFRAMAALAAHRRPAPDAEHEALRDSVLAAVHSYRAIVATGDPQEYQPECWLTLVEALNALDAYLDAHPALLAKYEALWATLEGRGQEQLDPGAVAGLQPEDGRPPRQPAPAADLPAGAAAEGGSAPATGAAEAGAPEERRGQGQGIPPPGDDLHPKDGGPR